MNNDQEYHRVDAFIFQSWTSWSRTEESFQYCRIISSSLPNIHDYMRRPGLRETSSLYWNVFVKLFLAKCNFNFEYFWSDLNLTILPWIFTLLYLIIKIKTSWIKKNDFSIHIYSWIIFCKSIIFPPAKLSISSVVRNGRSGRPTRL